MRTAGSAAAAIFLFAAALLAGGCDPAEDIYRTRFTAMGTLVDVNIAGIPTGEAAGAAAAVEALFRDREDRWDPWGKGELGTLNEALTETGNAVASGDLSGLLADAAGYIRAQPCHRLAHQTCTTTHVQRALPLQWFG